MLILNSISKSILALSLVASSLAHGLTADEAAQFAKSAQGEAAAKQKKRSYETLKLVDEISKLEIKVNEKINEVSRDRNIRNVSIGVTLVGAGLTAFLWKGGSAAYRQDNIGALFSLVALVAPAAGTAVTYQHFIKVDSAELANFKSSLESAKEKLLNYLNQAE